MGFGSHDTNAWAECSHPALNRKVQGSQWRGPCFLSLSADMSDFLPGAGWHLCHMLGCNIVNFCVSGTRSSGLDSHTLSIPWNRIMAYAFPLIILPHKTLEDDCQDTSCCPLEMGESMDDWFGRHAPQCAMGPASSRLKLIFSNCPGFHFSTSEKLNFACGCFLSSCLPEILILSVRKNCDYLLTLQSKDIQ